MKADFPAGDLKILCHLFQQKVFSKSYMQWKYEKFEGGNVTVLFLFHI
jgi:hypothetical protein